MTPGAKLLMAKGAFSLYRLTNNAAIYSLYGVESDRTYLTNGSGRVMLIADRSGNSPVNAWASGGAASNTATSGNKSVTGSQAFTFDLTATDYTPSADMTLISKLSGNDGFAVLLLTTGIVRLRIGDGASVTNVDSTSAVTLTDLTRGTIGVAWTDGVGASFTQNGVALGNAVAAVKTLTNAAVSATIGTVFVGLIYRVQVGSVYDFNPSVASKLVGSFSSGGDTWTVNASGDLSARISGARDVYQGTSTKMPALSTGADGLNIATFDGSNDYMKSPSFSLTDPTTIYFVGSQESWTTGDVLFDGNGLNRGIVFQSSVTPTLAMHAGSTVASNTGLALATRAVLRAVFNAALSSLGVNRLAPTVGNPGVANFNGITIGSDATGGHAANITFCELVARPTADTAGGQDRIAGFLINEWKISI